MPPEEITEVQWMLYDLHTIMRLHNAQEEEVYGMLDPGMAHTRH
jgi:hypothetical protein